MTSSQEIDKAIRLVQQGISTANGFNVVGNLRGKTVAVTGVEELKGGTIAFGTKTLSNGKKMEFFHSNHWENIHAPIPPINGMGTAEFNALALLNVYFVADMCYPGVKTSRERARLLDTLQNAGYLPDVHNVEEGAQQIAELYNQTIEGHCANNLPDGWEPTHDFWGAKCIAFKPTWHAPKENTLFTGDRGGIYETFDSAEALWETTNTNLKKIEKNESQLQTH